MNNIKIKINQGNEYELGGNHWAILINRCTWMFCENWKIYFIYNKK